MGTNWLQQKILGKMPPKLPAAAKLNAVAELLPDAVAVAVAVALPPFPVIAVSTMLGGGAALPPTPPDAVL
jgi:hypothetical protein